MQSHKLAFVIGIMSLLTANFAQGSSAGWAQGKQNAARQALEALLESKQPSASAEDVGLTKVESTLNSIRSEKYARSVALVDKSCLNNLITETVDPLQDSALVVTEVKVSITKSVRRDWLGMQRQTHEVSAELTISDMETLIPESITTVTCGGLIK